MLCILNPSRTHQLLVSYIAKYAYEYGNEAFMRLGISFNMIPIIRFYFLFMAVEIVYKLFFSKIEHSFGTPVKCFRYTTLFYTLYYVYISVCFLMYTNIYIICNLTHLIYCWSTLFCFFSFLCFRCTFFSIRGCFLRNQVVRISIFSPCYLTFLFFEGITP